LVNRLFKITGKHLATANVELLHADFSILNLDEYLKLPTTYDKNWRLAS
jgi:hypothetical protein